MSALGSDVAGVTPARRGLRARLRAALDNRLNRNIGWLSAAEMMNRVSRLVTAVVLARFLTTHDYGLAAIALTTYELVRVLTSNGLGAKIIQASDETLDAVCNTVFRMNWLLNLGLLGLQCAIAFPVAWFYQDEQLAWMLIVLSGVYLMYPLALVSAFRLRRQERFKVTALAMGAVVSLDNLLTAGFAFAGCGAWSVIYPKLLTVPIWVAACLWYQPWRPTWGAGFAHARDVLTFGKMVLGVEMLKTFRLNADNLIIGRVLGLEALGVYYFARNAGIGLTMSLVGAYGGAVLPHLAAARGRLDELRARYLHALKIGGLAVPALIVAQSLAAPWYVPLVFGERWVEAGALPILILLCLSALPRPLAEITSQLLRVLDRPAVDFYWSLLFTGLFTVAVAGAAWTGLLGVAVAVLLLHLICIPLFGLWVYRRFLPPGAGDAAHRKGDGHV